jgi:hypothetical protein
MGKDGISFVPQIRRPADLSNLVQLISQNPFGLRVAQNVEAESAGAVRLRHHQRAHPGNAVGAGLLIGHHRSGNRILRHGKIHLAVEPEDIARQTVPLIPQFQG